MSLLNKLILSNEPRIDIIEVIGHCLFDKTGDISPVGQGDPSEVEITIAYLWHLLGSLMFHSAKETLSFCSSSETISALKKINADEVAKAIEKKDPEKFDNMIETLTDKIWDYICKNQDQILIEDQLPFQIEWLEKRKKEGTPWGSQQRHTH